MLISLAKNIVAFIVIVKNLLFLTTQLPIDQRGLLAGMFDHSIGQLQAINYLQTPIVNKHLLVPYLFCFLQVGQA